MNQESPKLIVTPYTQTELAKLYGVGIKTFRAWLIPFKDEIGIIRGRCLTIPQVKMVFEKLDYPPCFQNEKT